MSRGGRGREWPDPAWEGQGWGCLCGSGKAVFRRSLTQWGGGDQSVQCGGIDSGSFPGCLVGFPCRTVHLGGMRVPRQPGFLSASVVTSLGTWSSSEFHYF